MKTGRGLCVLISEVCIFTGCSVRGARGGTWSIDGHDGHHVLDDITGMMQRSNARKGGAGGWEKYWREAAALRKVCVLWGTVKTQTTHTSTQ